ncbi:MAG: hypothetical protein AAGK33_13245 [Pseudomonadota bacterium]
MTETKSSKAIEAEIAQTRARIEQRFETMGADLTPTHLVTKALGTNPSNTQETVNAVIEKARTNPLSALLVGAGIAGLLLATKNEQRTAAAHAMPERDDYDLRDPMVHGFNEGATPEERIAHSAAHLDAQARGLVTNANAAAGEAGETVSTAARQAVHSAKQTVSNVVSQAGETVSKGAERAKAKAKQGFADMRAETSKRGRSAYASAQAKAKKAPTQARVVGDQAVGWVKENPVPAGLLALAAGATVASIFATSKASKPRARIGTGRELYEAAERDAQLIPSAAPAPTDVMPAPVEEMAPEPKARNRAATKKTTPKTSAKAAKPKKPGPAKSKLNGSKAVRRATSVLGEAEPSKDSTSSTK